jgi:hypothetical protein
MSRYTIIDPSKTPATDPRITRDSETGLEWQTVPFANSIKWKDADEACKALRLGGHDDWRLPTRAELLTLVDDTKHDPAIDTEAFPSTPSAWFWTSTPYAGDPDAYAWVVYFGYGYSGISYRGLSYRVRAVRGPARQ